MLQSANVLQGGQGSTILQPDRGGTLLLMDCGQTERLWYGGEATLPGFSFSSASPGLFRQAER